MTSADSPLAPAGASHLAPAEARPTPRPTDAALPTWDSAGLLAGQAEALIQHGDQTYRLRRTALGKLILTK